MLICSYLPFSFSLLIFFLTTDASKVLWLVLYGSRLRRLDSSLYMHVSFGNCCLVCRWCGTNATCVWLVENGKRIDQKPSDRVSNCPPPTQCSKIRTGMALKFEHALCCHFSLDSFSFFDSIASVEKIIRRVLGKG